MSAPFRTTRLVEFADTDMAGIVHFANFFRYMEAAEHAYLRGCGLSVFHAWQGETITFPRVHASCDFERPARFEDVLDVTVAIDRVGQKSVTYVFEFSRQGQAIASGRVSTVCCLVGEQNRLEAVEIPAGLRARLLDGL